MVENRAKCSEHPVRCHLQLSRKNGGRCDPCKICRLPRGMTSDEVPRVAFRGGTVLAAGYEWPELERAASAHDEALIPH
jgi:hypothetical protein